MKNKRNNERENLGIITEKYFVEQFIGMGYIQCIESKNSSKIMDSAKIDLLNLPFNIQIKSGNQKNMNPGKELFEMSNIIKSMFPESESVRKKDNYLIHKKQSREDVYMSLKTFNKIKEETKGKISFELRYMNRKDFEYSINSEYKAVVSISFEIFKVLFTK